MEEKKIGNGGSEEDVINAEYTEVPVYTAKVVSVHAGYCFLGKVRRGSETINTNGDVFAPTDKFLVDTIVFFEDLNTDPAREGKFRTEEIWEATGVKLKSLGKEARISVWQDMARRTKYHDMAKEIDPENVKKAIANEPFAEMVLCLSREEEQQGGVERIMEECLQSAFSSLSGFNLSSSVKGDVDVLAEDKVIESALEEYKKSGLEGQVESIMKQYASFKGIRGILTRMDEMKLLTPQVLIPIRHLPDLLVAAPIWFIYGKDGKVKDQEKVDAPIISPATMYFCDQVGAKQFAWFYQMYNRRTRTLDKFKGRDIIPHWLLEIINMSKAVFDYTVIATPYHDIASSEWANEKWIRNVDPFLFGFQKDIPLMFFLGRWSGTGLFPLMFDMVADTMDHLRLNKGKLDNFVPWCNWYRGDHQVDDTLGTTRLQCSSSKTNDVLRPFASQALRAYDEGWLFEFLRGEPKSESTMPTKAE